jgi:superfamily II DNA or RNA helicase
VQRVVTIDEAAIRRAVDSGTFLRGRAYADRGAVLSAHWMEGGEIFGEVRGTAPRPYTAFARLSVSPAGTPARFDGFCTCPMRTNCKHVVALLLAAVREEDGPSLPPAGWEQTLGGLVGGDRETPYEEPGSPYDEPAQVALELELVERSARTVSYGVQRHALHARPVVPGRSGNWVRSGISWQSLHFGYPGSARQTAQRRLLEEIRALSAVSTRGYLGSYGPYGYGAQTITLDTIASRRLWDLLAEARALGLPFVQPGKHAPPVTVAAEPAEATLVVRRSADGLDVEPRITADGEQVRPSASLLLGDPAHGIAWWQNVDEPAAAPKQRRLRLAPLAAPADAALRGVLFGDAVHVPAGSEERFLRDFYPTLRQRITVVPADDAVTLPEPEPPVLACSVEHLDGHRVAVDWAWSYGAGDASAREPLAPAARARGARDLTAERGTLAVVTPIAARVPELCDDGPDGPRLAPACVLDGIATARLLTEVVPALADRPDVTVSVAGDVADYRETDAAPVIEFSGERDTDEQDWFDLAVTVAVDGEDVPFRELFLALAGGEEYLVLPSGTFFRLDRDELAQLGRLIAEARALQDAPGETVRVSRFQADLWSELEGLGVVRGQAAAWQQTVRALAGSQGVDRQSLPGGLRASLRPYQRAGFDWLAFLLGHGLGGILADDMGLGKTLQTLALVAHARESRPDAGPFLVVAPTSVVPNWVSECRRFTPDLVAAAITETSKRRGADLAAAVEGADVVVTSYTLFRLEYDDYAALDWAGLVLDEAQVVKNHQSRAYQCAKRLPAPYKLAVTGTPMENNLMELWSLLSVTAPGLFPSPTRFDRYYRGPIEKGKDADLLAQLRRRVRPLMLRRSKEAVLTELPEKQEQVIELPLNSKHHTVYQTHLQRERQKVLGLLGDLDANRFEIFRSLTLLRQASLHAALIDAKYARVPSTKLDALMDQLDDVVADGHRAVVYSQFTRFLAAARQRLDAAGIDYCYLDGSTRNRSAVLSRFAAGDAPVFLVSLKAGGVGLNLTEADYCILLDPWWNPATEAQAVDRLHRIGQANKVMVYRLVAKDTIEEKVMALKAKKAALFDSVLADGDRGSGALTAADIRGLLD